MNTGITAVYIRTSTTQQSTDSQELELKRYCRQRGWKDSAVLYIDKISGAKAGRPALDKLMRRVREGKVKRLLVWKLDRLGRSLTHLALILEELNKLGVAFIATSQGIDTSDDSSTGRLQLGVLMAVAEFERALIKERVNAGLAAARERGVTLGRPATSRKYLAAACKLRSTGLSLREIARELKLSVGAVHKLLRTALV